MTTTDVSRPLPQLRSLSDIRDDLAQIESKRRRQLDKLPDDKLDAVAVAHRAAVVRIIEEVRIAQQRLEAGLYGTCTGCGEAIDPERLDFRPWATMCTGCSRRLA
jgi:RNA polymerase-binding transcription factor DksA